LDAAAILAWGQFFLSAALIIIAAIKLAEYGDAIAYRTGLGQLFIGALLLAGATSAPELLTMISSIRQGHINLTAGDLFGSSMFNMLLLGVLDIVFHQTRILRRVALRHALTASLGTLLTGMAVFFILADVAVMVGWINLDSLLMIAAYVVGVWLLRHNPVTGLPQEPAPAEGAGEEIPSLWRAGLGFVAATVVLILIVPWMVRSASLIAKQSGWGDGFVGMLLIAIVTSLPELVAMISAVRFGAYDIAVGNLFGSNIFNMFALASADLVYTGGNFFAAINPMFALAGLLAMLLTTLGLIGNLAQVERRIWIVELDALLLIVSYVAGMYLLALRGVGG
jgi:cation:H+ antiporter